MVPLESPLRAVWDESLSQRGQYRFLFWALTLQPTDAKALLRDRGVFF